MTPKDRVAEKWGKENQRERERENNCDRKIVSNPGVRMEKLIVAGGKKRVVKDEIEIEEKAKK